MCHAPAEGTMSGRCVSSSVRRAAAESINRKDGSSSTPGELHPHYITTACLDLLGLLCSSARAQNAAGVLLIWEHKSLTSVQQLVWWSSESAGAVFLWVTNPWVIITSETALFGVKELFIMGGSYWSNQALLSKRCIDDIIMALICCREHAIREGLVVAVWRVRG